MDNNKEIEHLKNEIIKCRNYSFKHRFTRNKVEEYLTAVIKNINPDKEFYLYIDELPGTYNYVAYKVNIQYASYSTYSTEINFNIEELQGNCSSVGVHHVTGHLLKDEYSRGSTHYLFNNKKQIAEFFKEIDKLCFILGYGNILYTISRESNPHFAKHVKENAKLLLSFRSPRNNNLIEYFSNTLPESIIKE
jgi:hypothetical protein